MQAGAGATSGTAERHLIMPEVTAGVKPRAKLADMTAVARRRAKRCRSDSRGKAYGRDDARSDCRGKAADTNDSDGPRAGAHKSFPNAWLGDEPGSNYIRS